MMKADVLNGIDTIRICTHYRIDGRNVDRMPFDITEGIEPEYIDMAGWGDTSSDAELPVQLQRYIGTIEAAVGVPITIVSLGPDRKETILREVAHAG